MMRLISRPGFWIWMMGVMVLSGTGMLALLLLMPGGQDVTLFRLAVVLGASALIAVPFSRGISKTMTAPVT